MIERPTPGEQVAGIAGLALILTMFLFAWFGFDVEGDVPGLDAFDAFSDWFNIILVFAAFSGMALALVGSGVARSPVSLSVITTVLAGLGTLILLIYIISPPSLGYLPGESIDLSRKVGAFLGLVELIALTVGGYMAMQEEGASFGSAADRLSDQGTQQHDHFQQPPQPPAPQDYQQQPPAQAPPAPPAQEQYPPPPPTQQPPPPPPPAG